MLAVMVFGQAATTIVVSTPAFLIPFLHEREGMSLAQAGLIAGAPNLGLVLSLFLWGAAADRFGERRVLMVGLTLTVAAIAATTLARDFIWLGIAFVASGAISACINNASGRLIAGWFPAERRGLAMGIRQTCQPLGVAIAAVTVPPIAAEWGIRAAIAYGGVLVLLGLIASACVVIDPVSAKGKGADATARSPYVGSTVLLRIHLLSILLVVPQYVLSTFGLVWFTLGFGWSELAAGALVASAQLLGAGGRIVVGVWSDKLGSRLRPLRMIAIACAVLLLACAGLGWADWAIAAAVVYIIASCVSVADNGLEFTAVAEIAGPNWAGRALGTHNTGQFLGASVTPSLVGALIALVGIPGALAITAITPAIAMWLVPTDDEAYGASVRAARQR